jgi:sodium-dependent phosphate transporter
MVYLHQYDYIFGIGTVFAMLDAFNNGASTSMLSYITITNNIFGLLES